MMNKLILQPIKFASGSFIFLSAIDRCIISFRKIDELNAMSPSFNPRSKTRTNNLLSDKFDYVIIWKYGYLTRFTHKCKHQLTYMNHPFEDDKQIIRFISALPGEWIKDKKTEVYHKIPEGFCWVECLNGADDSNTWGPVPLSLAIGKPVLKIRPFSRIVRGKKIERNIKKRLNIKNRVLDDDNINSFFI